MDVSQKEPCLVSAGQGFSVRYHNRYLFSKYTPQRAVQHIIDSIDIREGTLFLLYSPILQFPIDLLVKKISTYPPEIQKSCCILIVEHDKILYEFSQSHIIFSSATNTICHSNIITPIQYIYAESPKSVIRFVNKAQKNGLFPVQGVIRRTIRIDCSAATQDITVLPDTISFYAKLQQYLDDFIANFWKNRITLTHLGRLFTANMLKNISLLPKSHPLVAHSIYKPILICAAGCSLDDTLSKLPAYFSRKNIYIIAVDVTLIPLLKRNIVPDAVLSMEGQLAIEQAYVGIESLIEKTLSSKLIVGNPSCIHYICDISSRNRIARYFTFFKYATISFFMTEYCTEPFMNRVEHTKLVKPLIPPLGSVGLAAVEIALYLRDFETPIYVSGLDFSYPAGLSHCKEAPAPQKILRTNSYLSPAGSPEAAFKNGAKLLNSNKKEYSTNYTDIALSGYGRLFNEHFVTAKNVYTLTNSGFPLKIQYATLSEFKMAQKTMQLNIRLNKDIPNTVKSDTSMQIVNNFYTEERKKLLKIKKILTAKEPQKNNTPKIETQKELLSLIDTCSYLYLHFPDGYKKARLEQDFLNRVRAGIDYYLKICNQRN